MMILFVNKLVPNIKICQIKMNIIKNFPGLLVKLFVVIIMDPISAPTEVNALKRARSLASPLMIFLLIKGR